MNIMTDPITPKQVKFLKSLADERDWSGLDVEKVRLIKTVIRSEINEDGSLTAFVAKKATSPVIDALLNSCPKKPVATTAAPTYPASVTAPAGQELTWAQIKANAIALLAEVPASYKGIKYAVPNTDKNSQSAFVFYEVKEYKGKRYLNRLQGAPGDWTRKFVKYADYAGIVERIKTAAYVTNENESLTGPMAAAARFSDMYTICACCGAKLSNGKSIAKKFGPTCAKKFS